MDGSLGWRSTPLEGERLSSSPQRYFTALELAAAEQLIHLSESSSSGAAFSTETTPRRGGGAASASSSFSFTSSSSPRSVSNAPPRRGGARLGPGDVDDEDEQEVGGRPRRNRRLRPIAEIYAATDPIGAAPARGGGRKDKPAGARV